jgi:hypothetical protein
MSDELHELVLFVFRCDGKTAAIQTYEEESGISRSEAERAVARLARVHRIEVSQWPSRAKGIIAAVIATAGILLLVLFTAAQ